jgi:hypothetical protein
MKRWLLRLGLIGIGLIVGYGFGVYQWRGMAVIESYAIGFDQGYSTGVSDASIPGAEVVLVSPDGKIVEKRKNP